MATLKGYEEMSRNDEVNAMATEYAYKAFLRRAHHYALNMALFRTDQQLGSTAWLRSRYPEHVA